MTDLLATRTFDLGGEFGIFGTLQGQGKGLLQRNPATDQIDASIGGSSDIFVRTISYVVTAVGVVAGLILLGMLIMGAITFMTSAGDEKVLTRAKQQMTNAVIGFVILVMAYWIVRIIGTIFGLPNILRPTFIGP